MQRVGQFVIALAPGADAEKFKAHMTGTVFKDPGSLAATRITRGFSHHLYALDGAGDGLPAKYVWQATADLMGNGRYDFAQNAGKVQASVKDYGVLVDVMDLVDAEPRSNS